VTTQTLAVGSSPGNPFGFHNNVGFTAAYQWDTEGRMTSLQYPTVSATGSFGNMAAKMPIAGYQYDINGRLNGMTMDAQDGYGPQPFASAIYTPAGQLSQLSWGNWYTETRQYNSPEQLISQSVPDSLNMTYNYSATQNNGRIVSSVDGMTGESTSYTYDALNRLTAASNSLWNQSYTYDGFGNLLTKSLANGSPNPSPAVTMSYNSNNQQNGASYDANGNQTNANGSYNTFNVENRMVYNSNPMGYIYAYDPWGKRVMSGTGWTGSGQPSYTYTFWGITGQPLAMVNCTTTNFPANTCSITGQNVYFGKKMIVWGGVSVVTDRLGSVRANAQGEWFMYYPYGEERSSTVDGRNKFGTYFRDMVGQDYADKRYFGAGMGRFWSPDPSGMKAADSGNPTSWNLYAYVNGDPVNFGDPTGLDPNCGPGGTWMGEGCYGGTGYSNDPFSSSYNGASIDLASGEMSYVVGTVVPGYLNSALSSNPNLQQIVFPNGAISATINYGGIPASTLSGIVSAVTSAATYLPQQFYSGFVNALLNDETATGALQVAASLGPAAAGGVASGLSSTLPATTGSTLIVGETPVIGGLAYTSQYAGQGGYTVMPTVANYTFSGSNVPWLNSMISTGQSFVMGPGGQYTMQEIEFLTSRAGYTLGNGLLIPPVPWP